MRNSSFNHSVVKCVACRKKHSYNDVTIHNHKFICLHCYEKLMINCHHCSIPIWKNNPNTVKHNNKHYCKRCANILLAHCSSCDKIMNLYEERCHKDILNENIYCQDCASVMTKCHCCGGAGHESCFKKITVNGIETSVCDRCFRLNYFKCKHCNSYHPSSTAVYANDGFYCTNCANILFRHCNHCHAIISNDNRDEYCHNCVDTFIINSYFHKPEPVFYKEDNEDTNIFIGVELEIQSDSKLHRNKFAIKSYGNPFFYFKHDGSLSSDRGVEIVSHPATFSYHCNNQWSKLFELINLYQMNDIEGCGLHFHISRKGFINNKAIALLDYFVNNNEEKLSEIGGRPFGSYCHHRQKEYTDWGLFAYGDRHDSVNLTNEHTIEIRFCKSTFDYNVFIKRLTMVHNMVNFCNKYCDKNFYEIKYQDFIDFSNNENNTNSDIEKVLKRPEIISWFDFVNNNSNFVDRMFGNIVSSC